MANAAQQKMNEIVEKVIKNIEENKTGLWHKSWIGGLPQNYITKTPYSGFNLITLSIIQEEENYTSNNWLTFNQIRKIKGAKLKKGSTSTPIFFFKILEKKEEIDGKEKITKIPLLKFYNVFNTDQVEGLKIGSEKPYNANLDAFVSNCGIPVKNGLEAFYSPKNDTITIPDLKLFESTEAYASTLLHELTHATGHKSRLNRDLVNCFGSPEYAKEECIAELGSMFLCQHLNIKNSAKQAEAYIKGWLIEGLKADPKLLWKLASEAQKAYNWALAQQNKEEIAA